MQTSVPDPCSSCLHPTTPRAAGRRAQVRKARHSRVFSSRNSWQPRQPWLRLAIHWATLHSLRATASFGARGPEGQVFIIFFLAEVMLQDKGDFPRCPELTTSQVPWMREIRIEIPSPMRDCVAEVAAHHVRSNLLATVLSTLPLLHAPARPVKLREGLDLVR